MVMGYVALSIPVLGLTERPNFPVDRYSYLVHLMLVGSGIIWRCKACARKRLLIAGLLTVILVAEVKETRHQLRIWRDPESLFTWMVAHPKFADNARQQGHIYVMWGRHLASENEPRRSAGMFNNAQQGYLDAIKAAFERADDTEALSVLSHQEHYFGLTPVLRREKGYCLLQLDRPAEALHELRIAAGNLPDDLRANELFREASKAAAAETAAQHEPE